MAGYFHMICRTERSEVKRPLKNILQLPSHYRKRKCKEYIKLLGNYVKYNI